MTAFSRGDGRLRSFLRRLAGLLPRLRRPARPRKPVVDLRDIPDSLRRDIGLLDAAGPARNRSPAHRGETEKAMGARDGGWQRHLDRSIFPPV